MLREALVVLSFALALTVVVIAVVGLPPTASTAAATSTCSGPLADHPSVQWIGADDAAALLRQGRGAIVDTRDRGEYEAGHVAGAIHVPVDAGTLDADALAILRAFATVIAYCDASGQCARSIRFAGLLSSHGFRDVRVLEGGIAAWIDGGRAAESGVCRQCE